MKKRIVSVLLVMAMCVSMSACGSKGAEKKSDGSASGQKKLQLYMQVILEINLTMIHAMKVQKKQKKNWV